MRARLLSLLALMAERGPPALTQLELVSDEFQSLTSDGALKTPRSAACGRRRAADHCYWLEKRPFARMVIVADSVADGAGRVERS